MSNKTKLILTIVAFVLLVSIFLLINKNPNADEMAIDTNNPLEGIKEDDIADVEVEIQEKNLEEMERDIESKKPQSKISIKPLKDTGTGKEFLELDDAPLQYVVDGVDFKLNDNMNKTSPTIELTEEDINRIQSNGYDWHTGYVEKYKPRIKYGEYYEKYPEYTDIILEEYIPQRLDVYKNAKVGWLTDPNLVYQNAMGFYCVSGVIQISYVRDDNPFELISDKIYERDVEFRYNNTADGLSLVQIIYLSDWEEIK